MNYTLITGASKGIGKAFANACAAEGANLILVARSASLLDELAATLRDRYKVTVRTYPLDLLQDNAVSELYGWCVSNNYYVRILINNAGIGLWGNFKDQKIEQTLAMLKLNQLVLTEMVYQFLPMLSSIPKAHILNVASTAAFQPIPYFASYAATKSYTYSFSRAIRDELKESDINVSCLCPGPTKSDFFDNAGFDENGIEGIKMDADKVVRIALDHLFENKALIVPGFSNKVGVFMSRYLPSSLLISLTRYLFRPRK